MISGEKTAIACSVGIMAHNEDANIGRLLAALVSQSGQAMAINEIIVVASGCTDRTETIVRSWAERDSRIRLLSQASRQGKAAAVNVFLAEAREEIVALLSADVVLQPYTFERLLAPFRQDEIGMTACRPVPVNDPGTFMGFAAHLLWGLHHVVSLKYFKAGELAAFRRIIDHIPYDTAVDEASVEPVIRRAGYSVRYVPGAIVHNKGPETVADFLAQRRRIYAGHLALRDSVGYRVSTLSGLRILRLALTHLDWRPRQFAWTWTVAALEAYGRFLGWRDYKQKLDHSVWERAETTKDPEPQLSAEQLVS